MRIGMFFREALRSIRANAAISVAATVTAQVNNPATPTMRL
jgi:hypothetical protein